MNKLVKMDELFSLYGGLLSDRQRYAFEGYYLYDLSLSEIAEELAITKQAVSDVIKRAEHELLRIESVIRLREREQKIHANIERFKELIVSGVDAQTLIQALEIIESEQHSDVSKFI